MGDTATSTREYGRLYPIAAAVVRPTAQLLWRINTTGLHHVPHDGPAIFCPNHISFIDSIVLPVVLPRRISYVGKAEYMDSWKTRYLFPAIGMVPIDRSGGSRSQAALDTAARILERGEFFGIYPEGTRSRDGKLHRGHTGPARLALRTGAPIIPVGMRGTDRIQPPGAAGVRPFRSCQVNFGAPIDVDRYRGRADDRLLLRQLVDEVMYEIRRLSGQEYEDTYANKPPEAADEPATVPPLGATSDEVAPSVERPTTVDVEPAVDRRLGTGERVLVGVGADGGDDDVIEQRRSSADVLSQWWS